MHPMRKFKWGILLLCLAAFVVLAVFLEAMGPADIFVYRQLIRLESTAATFIFHCITSMASPLVLLVICFALVWKGGHPELRVPLMLNLVLSVTLNLALKSFFERTRPMDALILAQESGYSFPSGHTMAATCFYGFIVLLLLRQRPLQLWQRLLAAALSAMVLLVGISRIYLGVHYFSDVLAGFLVSIAYLIAYSSLVNAYLRHPEGAPLAPGGKVPFYKSFSYAVQGIVAGLHTERNMVIHFGVMALVVVFGSIFRLSATEWMICVLLFGLVFMAELLNTAVETLVDIVMPQRDARAKLAKDTAAGAVLSISIAAALIGGMIFLPKLWVLFQELIG